MTVLFCLVILFDLAFIAIDVERINLANRMTAGHNHTDDELDATDLAEQIAVFLYTPPFVIAGIVFMIWIYLASRNLSPLGNRSQTYSPGWAVGWFFIPVANLLLPFLIMKEMWKASDPKVTDGDSGRNAGVSPVVPIWWGLNVASIVLGVPFLIMSTNDSVTGLLRESWISLIGNVLEIGAAVLFIVLVWRMTSRQDEKNRNILIATPIAEHRV